MPYSHDVFISYASVDVEWARKLHQGLTDRGFDVWWDKDNLRAGDTWETEIGDAVDGSQHLIVLWSQHAKSSDWVFRERGRFDAILHPGRGQVAPTDRRMIIILLEGDTPSFSKLQGIDDLKVAGAYSSSVTQVADQVWDRVLTKVEDGLRVVDTRIPIPVVVLAMTNDRLAELEQRQDEVPAFGSSLRDVLVKLNVPFDQLKKCYGEKRTDWRPLGSNENIELILHRMNTEINQRLGDQQFRWDPLGPDFWSGDLATAQLAAARLASDLASVVIIDPISFYDAQIRAQFQAVLDPYLDRSHVIVMVLPPFAMPPLYEGLRGLIRSLANPLFRRFYEPDLERLLTYAQCNLQIADDTDMRRVLLTAIGRLLYRPKQTETPAVLWPGTAR